MPSKITLPSIQDLFPDDILNLPMNAAGARPRAELMSPGQLQHEYSRTREPLSPPPASLHRRQFYPLTPASPALIRLPPLADATPALYLPPRPRRRRRSEDQRKHVCEICGRAFNRPSSLAIHDYIHTGARPFTCPFVGCGREFNVKSNMRRHLRNSHPLPGDAAGMFYTHPLTSRPRALPRALSPMHPSPITGLGTLSAAPRPHDGTPMSATCSLYSYSSDSSDPGSPSSTAVGVAPADDKLGSGRHSQADGTRTRAYTMPAARCDYAPPRAAREFRR